MSPEADVRYRINDRDEITFVSEGWDQFAESNDGGFELGSDKVLGRTLWDFVSDGVTRQLYQQIVSRVRQGHRVQFKLRCDSPACRRYLEMTIHSADTGSIEFVTQSLQVVDRPAVKLLEGDTPRSSELLRACAWCNRIDAGGDEWKEVEVAVERLGLFETDLMPQLTHTICGDCFEKMNRTAEGM